MNKLIEETLDKVMKDISDASGNYELTKTLIKIDLINLFYDGRTEIMRELLEKHGTKENL